MDFEQVKSFIESNKDTSEEVQAYLQGFTKEVEKPLDVTSIEKYLNENEDAKKWYQSQRDSYFNKGLETWKTNNLEKLVEQEVIKRNPTKSEAEMKVDTLLKELEAQKQEAVKEKLRNKAVGVLNEKKLPISLSEILLGGDEESTLSNIGKFEEEYKKAVQEEIERRFAQGGRDPGAQNGTPATFTMEQIEKMTPDEINKNWAVISKVLGSK
jgi:hypothetical protein